MYRVTWLERNEIHQRVGLTYQQALDLKWDLINECHVNEGSIDIIQE